MFALLDLALLFGLIALVLWILAITGLVASLGGLAYIFLIVFIILLVVWFVMSFCIGSLALTRRGYFYRERNNVFV